MIPSQSSGDAADRAEVLKRALESARSGAREEAERLYRQVLQEAPGEPTALYYYGLLHWEEGRRQAAVDLMLELVRLHPDHIEGQRALADIANVIGRPEQAIAGYRKVLELQPGHPAALMQLASMLLERGFVDEGDFDGAVDVCRAAIAMLPDPGPAQAVLGRILLAAGRAGEAVEAYRAALALAPAKPSVLSGLALAELAAGEEEAALASADAALALEPDLADALFVRGSALLALRQAEAAALAFERGAALKPEQARMHLGLGDAYAELDQAFVALKHLSRAVELEPANTSANANLGSILYRCGDLDAAERFLRLALAADPKLVVAHQNLAGILGDRGDAEGSRRHRDIAYGLRNVLVSRAPNAKVAVLILTTSDSGNIPHRYLLRPDRYTKIDWFIEYAPEGQAAQLPPYDLVFNIIGDPDYSAPTEAPVAAFLRQSKRPLLNDPVRVPPTRRDRLPGLLEGIDNLLAPRVARLEAPVFATRGLAGAIADTGLKVPLLVRPFGSHGGFGLVLARTDAELDQIDVGDAEGVYVTEFVDFASAADGRYRKYRIIFIDRQPYPYHLAVADSWLVHYVSAKMTGDAARQAEERQFLDAPEATLGSEAMAAIRDLGRRLDLDYAGVDFSILPDGRVLVFEANATMLVHPELTAEFAYKNPHVERITDAFEALIDRRLRLAGS